MAVIRCGINVFDFLHIKFSNESTIRFCVFVCLSIVFCGGAFSLHAICIQKMERQIPKSNVAAKVPSQVSSQT